MISRAFFLPFVTLATSLLFSPSASAVEILTTKAEGDRTEIATTKCSDPDGDHGCPHLRRDSVSIIQGEIQRFSNEKNTKEVCNDQDGKIVCPPATEDAKTTTSE